MILDVAMIALVAALLILVGVQIAALRVAYDTNRLARQAVQALDDMVRMVGNGVLARTPEPPPPPLPGTAVQQAAADVREAWQGERSPQGDPHAACRECRAEIALTPYGWAHLSGVAAHPVEPPVGLGGEVTR